MSIPKRPGPRQDDGLFGPDSICWEVLGHPAVLISGIRSVYYSALNSEVSQAVEDHSTWYSDPLTRGRESNYWVVTSVFGDTADARRAGKWVQGRHANVKGKDPVTGNDYSPSRPDLAIAGHCLIWDSNLAAYEAYGRRLSDDEREQYWQEGLIVAELLGIDVATLPQSWEQWRSYYKAEIRPALNLSTTAYGLLRFTRGASFAPWWSRPLVKSGMWLVEELTVATLPPLERGVLGRQRSAARVALTRQLGHALLELAGLPPVRDAIERQSGGERAHELMQEARAIRSQRGSSRRGRPPTDSRRQTRDSVAA